MNTIVKAKTLWLMAGVCLILNGLTAQSVNEKFSKVKEVGGIEEYLYKPNGMNILLVQDNSAPVVTVQIVYRVGSKHEVSGNTGSTHLLEHLNFKGTPKFNKRKGTAIFNVLQGIGAQMNATTWNDRTNYYETIPSDKIELALEIEADRMRNSLLLKEDKDAEMTVVRNEFERGENNPNSVLSKEVWATAYMAHTYHHTTIGWRSDIENMPIEVLRKFYNTYYWPDNATMTIIGDFQKEQLFPLVDKYFGVITKAPHDMPQPYTKDPVQTGPRRITVKKNGQTAVVLTGFKIPGRLHEDFPALKVLGQLLGKGTNAVLSKTFVDTGKAFYTYASPSEYQDVGLFSVGIGFAPDASHDVLYKELTAAIEKVKKEGFTQEEIDRIVSKLNAQSVLSRDGSGSVAGALTEAIAAGDWTDYINAGERLKKVTAADVKRVANQYLVEDQSTTGYFIPVRKGANKQQAATGANFLPNLGKYFFRNPDMDMKEHQHSCQEEYGATDLITYPLYQTDTQTPKRVFGRKTIGGIDVITSKTGAKDFVTIVGSFPIGSFYDTEANPSVPEFATQMLSKGTQKNDKFAFAQKLEKMGASLNISEGEQTVSIYIKALKKDVTTVMDLLAEQLRYPLFDEKELENLKTQSIGYLKQLLSDPGAMGSGALSRALYPQDHPNYTPELQSTIANVEKLTVADLKAFHQKYFGPAGMHMVAVGDVDEKQIHAAIKKSFKGWKGGIVETEKYTEPNSVKAGTQVISIPQKPSAEMFIGQYTGLKQSDADYLPFYIANYALGAGFSGRLMMTVRDNDGLTYSISSNHSGHKYSGGHWMVNASFNPELFQKGLDATMAQVNKWVNNGITAKELAAKQQSLVGSFKVGMATTGGLARTILNVVETGKGPEYIDQYPKDIEAVTLDQVNAAIKKYIDLDKLIIIKAGSLNEDGQPMK